MALKNWAIDSISAATMTDLVSVGSGNAAAVVGMTITNMNAGVATISVSITTSGDTVKATILHEMEPASGDTYFIDSKVMLASTEKLRVQSDVATVSFSASGDESVE